MGHRINEEITARSVLVFADDGTLEEVELTEALRRARSRQLDLVEEWPSPPPPLSPRPPTCVMARIAHPLRWEARATVSSSAKREPLFDPDLWFTDGTCPARHFLLGNSHTFVGRALAWCPEKRISYCVSKAEMQTCSRDAAYYMRGLLAGQEPDPPVDDERNLLPSVHPDYDAWLRATELLAATGVWNDRFRTCEDCGARLLQSNPGPRCRVHVR